MAPLNMCPDKWHQLLVFILVKSSLRCLPVHHGSVILAALAFLTVFILHPQLSLTLCPSQGCQG